MMPIIQGLRQRQVAEKSVSRNAKNTAGIGSFKEKNTERPNKIDNNAVTYFKITSLNKTIEKNCIRISRKVSLSTIGYS